MFAQTVCQKSYKQKIASQSLCLDAQAQSVVVFFCLFFENPVFPASLLTLVGAPADAVQFAWPIDSFKHFFDIWRFYAVCEI